MQRISLSLVATLLIFTALFSASVFAELKVGDALVVPELEDQFEQKQQLSATTKWLLFCHDMDSTKIIREALEGQTSESLDKNGIQIFADISGMPGFVRRFIAIPKLKDLAYPMALAREEELLAAIPREEDKATILELEQGKVKSVTIVDSVEQLKEQLAL